MADLDRDIKKLTAERSILENQSKLSSSENPDRINQRNAKITEITTEIATKQAEYDTLNTQRSQLRETLSLDSMIAIIDALTAQYQALIDD